MAEELSKFFISVFLIEEVANNLTKYLNVLMSNDH